MQLGVVDVIVIISHPILGSIVAYLIYKQWTSLKKSRSSSFDPDHLARIRLQHEKNGKLLGSLVGATILLAIAAEAYRGMVLDVPLSGLISLHGWLGIILFLGAMGMRRTGTRISEEIQVGKETGEQKRTQSKLGGAMMVLLVIIVFRGFLRLLQVLG